MPSAETAELISVSSGFNRHRIGSSKTPFRSMPACAESGQHRFHVLFAQHELPCVYGQGACFSSFQLG